jgi:hypothetical protein
VTLSSLLGRGAHSSNVSCPCGPLDVKHTSRHNTSLLLLLLVVVVVAVVVSLSPGAAAFCSPGAACSMPAGRMTQSVTKLPPLLGTPQPLVLLLDGVVPPILSASPDPLSAAASVDVPLVPVEVPPGDWVPSQGARSLGQYKGRTQGLPDTATLSATQVCHSPKVSLQ